MSRAYKDRLQCTVSGTPGTGTITVGAASSGFRTFEAGDDGKTFHCVFTDGSAAEKATDCLYTHSGTTLSRGTFVWSTTGSPLSLTSAAIVANDPSAADGTRWEAKAVEEDIGAHLTSSAASVTTSNVTGVVGTMHVLDISGATANRDFVLPATAAEGSRVGVMLSTGDDTYALLIKPAAGDTINSGSAGAEWSRLFITSECVILRCVTADSAWVIEKDGRIAQKALLTLSGSVTSNSAATFQYVTAVGGSWTATVDNCSMTATASDKITARRAGVYTCAIGGRTNSAVADGHYANFCADLNGAGTGSPNQFGTGIAGSGLTVQVGGSFVFNFAAGDYVRYMLRTQDADKGLAAGAQSFMGLTEVLP